MIVVKSAFLQKRPRNHGCTDLVRVNPIPCNVGRMTVLEVIIKNSLQIDKTAAIFFGQPHEPQRRAVHQSCRCRNHLTRWSHPQRPLRPLQRRKIRLRSLRIHGSDHQRVSVPLYHRPRKESRKPVRTARQSARLSERLQSESSGPPEKRRRCRHSSDIFYARIRKMRKSGYAAETPHNSSRADLQCDGIVRFTGGCGIKEQKIYQ